MTISSATKTRFISFLWQHVWLLMSLFVMTFGVAMSVRSNLGSSVISTIPFVLTLAGGDGMAPPLTIGEYTYIMNFVFVMLQIVILRRQFELVQLFQLIIGFFFGWFLDLNMELTSILTCESLWSQILVQLIGCTVLGIGIAFEIKCGSVTMPGEGITVAVAKVSGMPFPKAKIIVDTTLVVIAVILGYVFFSNWLWQVTGPGTLFAMVYVGIVVKLANAHIGWFDQVLHYVPGFRKYIYGLAKFVYRKS